MKLVDVDGNLDCLNGDSDKSQFIVLTRPEQMSRAKSLMANKSRVHLIVSSNGPPMADTDDYTVVLQQKFGDNHHLCLLKKVTCTYVNVGEIYFKRFFFFFVKFKT